MKKTALEQYSRPLRGGIIAIKIREDDELVDVVVTRPGDEVVLSTAQGMAIRFNESDARPMGRNTSGVKGIKLSKGDSVVGMVVAEPEATLLTVCANGYGKRTPFGPNEPVLGGEIADGDLADGPNGDAEPDVPAEIGGEEDESAGSQHRYRTQRRGGKGLRDIKTTDRNGPVVGVVGVRNGDEVLMITARGKLQRIVVDDVSVIGRNTQGVRVMSLDEADTVAAVVLVPPDEADDEAEVAAAPTSPATPDAQ